MCAACANISACYPESPYCNGLDTGHTPPVAYYTARPSMVLTQRSQVESANRSINYLVNSRSALHIHTLLALIGGKWQAPPLQCHTEQFHCSAHSSPCPSPGYHQSVGVSILLPFLEQGVLGLRNTSWSYFRLRFSLWCPFNFPLSHLYGDSLRIRAQQHSAGNPHSKVHYSFSHWKMPSSFPNFGNCEQKGYKHLQADFCVDMASATLGKYLGVQWLGHGHKNARGLIRSCQTEGHQVTVPV